MKGNFWHIWVIPLVLGSMSLLGLIAGLIGDGLLDVISWVNLAVPLLVIGWFIAGPQSGRRKQKRW